jgi:hypothetical protein
VSFSVPTIDANHNTTVSFTVSFDPVYGIPDPIKWVEIFVPGTWGQPSGTIATLGIAPVGNGGKQCRIVASPPDPTATDPAASTYTCNITLPVPTSCLTEVVWFPRTLFRFL